MIFYFKIILKNTIFVIKILIFSRYLIYFFKNEQNSLNLGIFFNDINKIKYTNLNICCIIYK